jgi:Arylsulfotransferase (ASST)
VPVLAAMMLGGASGAARIAVPARLTALLLALTALVAVIRPGAASASAGAARLAATNSTPITISPAPGTPDVSPDTQISILGVARNQIRSVRVRGSASGLLRGAVHAYSGRRGASFVLSRPLTHGERVQLTVVIKGRPPINRTFTVAHPGGVPPTLNLPVQQPAKLQHFVSRPDLLPPKIQILRRTSGASSGDIFLTPLPSPVVHPESNNSISIHPVGPGGPMIIDGRGRLIWFDQVTRPAVATNFRVQRFAAHRVLTWWQGTVTVSAFGNGEGVIADNSYRTVTTVKAGNGFPTDLHEFVITPAGDALFTIYSPVMVHLLGTPAGKLSPLLDSIVQEVDVRTGLVMWEWHAYGHIPLADSYATPANSASYDAYHINSIEPEPNGRVLISARDTSAVYEVDQVSGRILWTLGGKASSFRLAAGARFYFQHDAHLVASDRVSLFDDEAGPPVKAPSSRGLILGLDFRHRRARVVRQYRRPGNDTSAQSEGSTQLLASGNAFVGFGSTQFFTEFSPRGRLVFDASLPVDDGSYRAFRFPWNATPTTPPAAVAKRTSAGKVSVYASWNGATGVTRWQLLSGEPAGTLRPIATVPNRAFETRIDAATTSTRFQVRALGSRGRVLGRSAVVSTT